MSSGAMIMILGGGAMLLYLGYDWMQYRFRMRMRRELKEEGAKSRVSYDWRVYVMLIFTIVLALLYAIPRTHEEPSQVQGQPPDLVTDNAIPIAIYILVVGIAWTLRQARKEKVSERRLINDQVAELVPNFRAVFRFRPTVFSALEEANRKIPPPVGSAVAHAVTTFYVTAVPRRALDELRGRIQNAYMEQFIYILERGEDAKHEDIIGALDGMLMRLRRARDIRDHSEVNMTVINGQTRIMQFIAITTVTIVGIVPTFRLAYETIPGQLVFFFFATLGVSTSWYIDKRASELKERVL
jgi:hypothetical protein